MTVPQSVAALLRAEKPRRFCDGCTAKRLGLGAGQDRSMARNATSALAQTREFRRAEGVCADCGQERLVTWAV
jgi:hypothetical protein